MIYITQILVSYEQAIRQLKIKDSYDWHQRVWQAFRDSDGEKRDFLSRVDEIDEAYRLLIISPLKPIRPDWCPIDCFKSKDISEAFFSNGRYRFSLLANPTRKIVVRNEAGQRKKNGRRIGLTNREDLSEWLLRKASDGGFNIDSPEQLRIIPKPRSYFQKMSMSGVHSVVEFQGVLSVTDPIRFRTTFARGLGSAKAFGLGLLAIAPL